MKFAVSFYLMHKFPHWNEGYLSSMKGKMVSNQNLLYCASSIPDLNLPGMINSVQLDPIKNWTPPLISAPKNLIEIIKDQKFDPRTLENVTLSDREIEYGIGFYNSQDKIQENALLLYPDQCPAPADSYYAINRQYISDKVVADSVEAILGTTLQTYGIAKNLEVLQFFGIINFREENPEAILTEKLVHARIRANISNREVDQFLVNCEVLETKLNYKFQDRAYLLSALTHPSYPSNRITGCYQQLEFLGDAILDFLITCYIVEQNTNMNPGKLTDLRMALVNNDTLGCICIRNQFHKHLLYDNAALSKAISSFEKFQEQQNYDVTSEILLLKIMDRGAPAEGYYVDVPKALGDVVESLIGAVFLDTNNNLVKTWDVIYGLLKDEIHKFTVNVPIQVVRELYEYKEANPEFSEHVEKNGNFCVDVTFTCRGRRETATGFGKNSKQAKQAAAKSALAYLQQY